MKDTVKNNKALIGGVLIGIVAVYVFSGIIIDKKLNSLESHLDSEIQKQEEELKELALITSKGASNEFSENFIKDCRSEERKQFDQMLASLDKGLSAKDLTILNGLFARCGDVFANRRHSMVWQIEQGVDSLDRLLTEKNILNNEDQADNDQLIKKWQELLAKEKAVQQLFASQVEIQDKIIKTLLSGHGVNSNEINDLRREANEIQTELTMATEAVANSRSGLDLSQ